MQITLQHKAAGHKLPGDDLLASVADPLPLLVALARLQAKAHDFVQHKRPAGYTGVCTTCNGPLEIFGPRGGRLQLAGCRHVPDVAGLLGHELIDPQPYRPDGTLPEVMPYFEPFADSRWSARGYGHWTGDGPECWDGETWAPLYPWGHVHHYAAVGQFVRQLPPPSDTPPEFYDQAAAVLLAAKGPWLYSEEERCEVASVKTSAPRREITSWLKGLQVAGNRAAKPFREALDRQWDEHLRRQKALARAAARGLVVRPVRSLTRSRPEFLVENLLARNHAALRELGR